MNSYCRIRAIGVFTLLAVVACGEDATGPDGPVASFFGSWAGDAWEGEAWAAFGATGDTLYIAGAAPFRADASSVGGPTQSTVFVRFVYSGPGVYRIGPGDATFTRFLGGDVAVSTFGTFGGDAGWISVVEDSEGRLGGFVSFEAQDVREPGPDAPTSRFEGVFHAGVPE